ncbi:hypothetical protein [Zymomonas sp.]|uniref:hypothetical protein n=1 Tax=Zymomonas sp. TaxID=2068624 RepID=UPI0025D66801|nr:hypothetical protein [Zymomonas sp.]MCA1956596.1 hypothetical protein [Zymomonas sp.]
MSKIHARSDGQGRPLAFELTGGEVSDYSGADSFIDIPVTTPRRFLRKKDMIAIGYAENGFFSYSSCYPASL